MGGRERERGGEGERGSEGEREGGRRERIVTQRHESVNAHQVM